MQSLFVGSMDDSNSILLALTVIVPLLSGLALLVVNSRPRAAKMIAFIGFSFPLVAAIKLTFAFSESSAVNGYAFISKTDLGLEFLGIRLYLGLNGIALPLYLLAATVGLAAGLYAMQSKAERLSAYLMLLLFMQGGLMGIFCSIDLFFFYFFHELALIPTFIMIGLWGGQGRRVAAMEMTIYLTLGAMLSLLGLIWIYFGSGLESFDLISLRTHVAAYPLSETLQRNIFGFLLFGFGILVSLFPFHSWAPRGYVAAPTSVAMLHAGVLKKFGLYGLIQIAAPLLSAGAGEWSTLLAWLALGNIVVIGLITTAQSNLKQMVAYSSVMHMGFAFLGIVSLSVVGVGGAVMLMFAHGLSIALLFMLATCIHHRCGSYDMHAIGGLGPKAPILSAVFIAAIMASIGLPGFANFWGELPIFISLWAFEPWMIVPAVSGIVISAVYGLRAIARIFFGSPTKKFHRYIENTPVADLGFMERVPAFLLLGGLFLVGFWPQSISLSVNKSVEAIYLKNSESEPQTSEVGPMITPEAFNLNSKNETIF